MNYHPISIHLQLNFWKTSKSLNGFWDVMVDQKVGSSLLQKLDKYEIAYLKTIDDVQKFVRLPYFFI